MAVTRRRGKDAGIMPLAFDTIVESSPDTWTIETAGSGPPGRLPLTAEMLREQPSGDIFGLTQNAGMGWDPRELLRPQFLLLSTQGGVRRADGRPIALGYHTGHWEVGLLMQAAAEELARLECLPFAAFVSDPCDGRTQGTAGMMDSLAYRNDAAIVFRRLIRSLPTRAGVLGIATCDKGLPAMMLALVAMRDLPCVLVPGGVTLPPRDGEDAGKVQSIGARFAHGELTLERAAGAGLPRVRLAGRRLPVPGDGGDLAGGRRGPGTVAAALRPGALGAADLARHGAPLGPRPGQSRVARDPRPRDRHRRRRPQRDGRARRLRRLDEPPPAHAGHRPRRRPARGPPSRTGARSTARCRASSMPSPTARIPRCACSSPAASPRSCCTCGAPASSTTAA